MPSPLNYYFLFTCLVFLVKSDKCGPTNLLAIRIKNFSNASFFSIFITPHIVYLLFVYPETYFLFTSNFRNILFVYLVTWRDRRRRDGIRRRRRRQRATMTTTDDDDRRRQQWQQRDGRRRDGIRRRRRWRRATTTTTTTTATARRATARRDTMTTKMATGDDGDDRR